MGMQINTNIAALNSYRNLSNTQNDLSKSLEKLSSGLRINRAADDAAGLAISEGLRSQIGGLNVAARNAQDGISVIQTAEGALTEVHSILQRIRDLAVQAGNDSNNVESRAAISTEASALVDELDRIGQSTNFNGIALLDGSQASLKFQVGADGDASSQIGVSLVSANVSTIASALSVGNTGTTFATTDANAALATGAHKFTFTEGTTTTDVNVTLGAAGSYKSVQELADALNADEGFSAKAVASVEYDAAGAATGINVKSVDGGTVTATAPATAGLSTAGTAGTAGALDFTTPSGAQAAIKLIDNQITGVSTSRADLGAIQNRFESAINTLNVSKENLTAAESRIRDTDMASEMVNYTRSNILSQAGTAMLAQANQSNQGVLQLLG
ncbi:MAG TPA: flagellin [Mycetocola sp.]|jgi:flagellin|uniref:flagellin N-terminal helical domain-containing protein n=1 Tax=Mycetocola sp. TaxID=1871042 RepID=UPI00262DE3D8|nr:flagellin [Mycetocola sp.]MCU1561381.1 flagellin [Mycetocola sp.]HEV7848751.1 flagellin [Mycetocola sp.]